jgi:uncharacterized protein
MPELWFALLIVGVIAGVASGMFGIGGGLVIVPALTVLLGFTQLAANGTSLAALLMPVSIFAVIAYYRAGLLKISVAAWVAVGLFVGGYLGGTLAIDLPADILKRLYGIFLLYMAWRFAEPRKWIAAIRSKTAPSTEVEPENESIWYVLLIVGFIAGIMSGLFGIGGGAIIVPALVALLRFDQKRAVGTSLAALLLPNIPVVIPYFRSGNLNFETAIFVALGLIGGAFAGAKIALRLPSTTVKRMYGIFLLFVALRFIFS